MPPSRLSTHSNEIIAVHQEGDLELLVKEMAGARLALLEAPLEQPSSVVESPLLGCIEGAVHGLIQKTDCIPLIRRSKKLLRPAWLDTSDAQAADDQFKHNTFSAIWDKLAPSFTSALQAYNIDEANSIWADACVKFLSHISPLPNYEQGEALRGRLPIFVDGSDTHCNIKEVKLPPAAKHAESLRGLLGTYLDGTINYFRESTGDQPCYNDVRLIRQGD